MAESEKKQYEMTYKGYLKGHNGWVTSMQLGSREGMGNFLISSSRDKSVLVWKLDPTAEEGESYGKATKMYTGHSHFVQELSLSNDCAHCLTASWDGLIRMWDLNEGKTVRLFKGHTKDVLSVAFSQDNRLIISGGRDRTIRLWNILGENKFTIESAHNDWVSSVRFSPDTKQNLFFSAGWDRKVKLWDKTKMSEYAVEPGTTFSTHYLNTLAVAPSGAFVATGGKEGMLKIWSVKQRPDSSFGLEPARNCALGSEINTVAFSPKFFWVACGCDDGIKLYDFKAQNVFSQIAIKPIEVTQKTENEEEEEEKEEKEKKVPKKEHKIGVTSMCMDNAGKLVFAGCTDKTIRVYEINEQH
jgi:guanine nucleotide-binding protein subunit beta-2-like 1 protein